MTVEVRFLDEAVSEAQDAAQWYQDRRRGLGLAFLAALDGAVSSMQRWPRAAPLVEDISEEIEIRRAAVPRFPYYVAYLVTDEAIIVLAVAHNRRRPRYWSDRGTS